MILFSALFAADGVLLSLAISAVFTLSVFAHFFFFQCVAHLAPFPGSLNSRQFPTLSRFSPIGFLPIRVSRHSHTFRSRVYWENGREMGVFRTHTGGRCCFDILKTGELPMKENALKELCIDELRDIYSAENQLTKALPKMAKAATSDELRAGFEEHLERTKGHVERLERIFKELGEKPTGKAGRRRRGPLCRGGGRIPGATRCAPPSFWPRIFRPG